MARRNVVHTDVLIIGGGPAGLSTAIHLSDLIQADQTESGRLPLNIMVLDKGSAIGSHILSGAVINPRGLRKLLPDVAESEIPFESPVTKEAVCFFTKTQCFELPFAPPFMGNRGNYVASLGKITRWLGTIAEKKGVAIYPGFCGYELLYEGPKVVGVRTGDSGIDKHGHRQPNYQPGTEVMAKITVLAEGARGHLTKALIRKAGLDEDRNPQVYSLGVKEVWEVPEGTFQTGRILHSLGFPMTFEQFGGGFVYGLSSNQVAVGLAVGLDYRDPTFDPYHAFQIYKTHPFIRRILGKGKMVKYGAKTIPEGGLFSMPRFYHDGVLIVGDAAGFLSMPSLKGIHLGIESGMLAARTAFEALKKKDVSEQQLSIYEGLFRASDAYKDLYPVRNFRQGFHKNLFFGSVHFGTQLVTGGHGLSFSGRLAVEADAACYRPLAALDGNSFKKKFRDGFVFDKQLTFDKVTDVFYSGTQHDEHQPCHLKVTDEEKLKVSIEEYGEPSQYFCPAEVYELVVDPKSGKKELRFHPANCVHCKTCDIKAPFGCLEWTPPYGGDGPEYENM